MTKKSFREFLHIQEKKIIDTESIDGSTVADVDASIQEALTTAQRIQRGRQMKKIKHKIALGRKKAMKRMATKDTLEKRAIRQARTKILKKLTKGLDKGELSFSRRQELEKRLGSPAMKRKIAAIAKKSFKDVRKQEIERKRAKSGN